MKKYFLILAVLTLTATLTLAQNLTLPPGGANQKCVVTQYIGGLTHVTVKYNSPDVTAPNGDDRTGKIWGQLVPYGLTDLGFGLRNPSPWRVGANENTVIKISHDVEIEGEKLAAGKYGLHLIAQETGPWTWIFSHNNSAWGSFFYDESEDALRVDVTPEKCDFREWLTFDFTDRQAESAVLALEWENMRVPMSITVPDMTKLYTKNLSSELQGSAGFTHTNWSQAANYLVQNEGDLDKALTWADAAINAQFVGVKDWNTMSAKAGVLMKMGKMPEAEETMIAAVELPGTTALQIHGFGRQLIGQGMKDKALKFFEMNHKRFDGAWPTNVGMARGLSAVGRYDEALKYAEMAAEEAPDQLNKDSMNAAVEKLKSQQDIN